MATKLVRGADGKVRRAPVESQRKTPHQPEHAAALKEWGQQLFRALKALGQSAEWLGEQVGYSFPPSMRQVINGHQGVSREIYDRILEHVPAMRDVTAPPIKREKQGKGAYGPHKPHEYPDNAAPHRGDRW